MTDRPTDPRDCPVRFSALKLIGCPAKYRHAILTGYDATMSMKMGTAAHAVTLEPHRVRVFKPGTWTDDKGKTKAHAGKRTGGAWAQFKAAQPADAVILTPSELHRAEGIAAALHDHPIAAPLLFGPGVVREQPIAWSREGRACSSLPDARVPGVQVTDLKTCRSAKPERFLWDIIRQGYREQLRMYDEADAFECGRDVRTRAPIDLHIVAVESVAPYVVQVYTLHSSAINAADRNLERWWADLRACESANVWPGYTSDSYLVTDEEPGALADDSEIDDDTQPTDDTDTDEEI